MARTDGVKESAKLGFTLPIREPPPTKVAVNMRISLTLVACVLIVFTVKADLCKKVGKLEAGQTLPAEEQDKMYADLYALDGLMGDQIDRVEPSHTPLKRAFTKSCPSFPIDGCRML